MSDTNEPILWTAGDQLKTSQCQGRFIVHPSVREDIMHEGTFSLHLE